MRAKSFLFILACFIFAGTVYAGETPFSEFTSYQKAVDVQQIGLNDPVWDTVIPVRHPLQRQFLVLPKPAEVGVKEVFFQSVHDGKYIAFRLTWKDSTRNDSINVVNFSDAAALEFPVRRDPLPKYFMGEEGKPVHVIYWKAWRSKDQDQGFQTVKTAYPNMTSDIYTFDYSVKGKGTDKTQQEKEIFIPGRAANNPLSFPHKEIVEELSAEGPGTLTSKNIENTRGVAEWKNGTWTVLFVRPLAVNDASSVQFRIGEKMPLAIAVWEGGHLEVGGRKAVSPSWAEVKVE
ncbi:MAG: ethylbenzene dehydrogenase-related protein [bacterium]